MTSNKSKQVLKMHVFIKKARRIRLLVRFLNKRLQYEERKEYGKLGYHENFCSERSFPLCDFFNYLFFFYNGLESNFLLFRLILYPYITLYKYFLKYKKSYFWNQLRFIFHVKNSVDNKKLNIFIYNQTNILPLLYPGTSPGIPTIFLLYFMAIYPHILSSVLVKKILFQKNKISFRTGVKKL